MPKHVVIIHGWDASPEANWFQWLRRELEAAGIHVSVPAMPDAAVPDINRWIQTIKEVVPEVNEQVFFVGHSLGCITIAHFLQALPESQKAGGCVFVAGFSGNIHNPATCAFYQKPLDVELIKEHGGSLTAIFSEDDPVVPLKKAREFGVLLGAKLIVVQNMGHFVGSRGVTQLPLVLTELKTLMTRFK